MAQFLGRVPLSRARLNREVPYAGPLSQVDERWLEGVTTNAVSPAPSAAHATKPRRIQSGHMVLPGPWIRATGAKTAHDGDEKHTLPAADANRFEVLRDMDDSHAQEQSMDGDRARPNDRHGRGIGV